MGGTHIVLLVIIVILTTITLHYRQSAINANKITTDVLSRLENAQSTANAFLNAARLIEIHRNGRLNVFTFARRDQVFIIETFGVMSDQPDKWREQAGLSTPDISIQTFGER